MFKLNKIDDFNYVTFPSLEKYDDLFHCFTTRLGGVSQGCFSSLNLGLNVGDDRENVTKNYEILTKNLNLNKNSFIKTFQTHTNNIKYVTKSDTINVLDEAKYKDIDGLITDNKGIVLMSFHADCTPIYLYDPIKKVIGMVHAGWRGTVDNITGLIVEKFIKDFNSNPEDIQSVIGPSLGQCCFEVDEDVAEIFLSKDIKYKEFMIKKGIKYYFDLWEINKHIMIKKGLREENIEISELCTKCHNDLFFSHRGQQGKRGLMAGLIMMK
ncbi:peptidoglycan editing factor PgeF [Sedimentibacter sp. MB31-C6]|uniref:peptidoglycan editing factor PgeF n=1 Tax=Sedimentibacter sp. MB31-C6 TaxID=3109366 RepID=UPI002DDD20F8|nr:peptidoglycan editing factor PgeF [Sedimentibacter sp. MB36-C1]WSI05061.1 peptidoglycan editing factor PgeF [Sedimentibacter sp. MB36-C1]